MKRLAAIALLVGLAWALGVEALALRVPVCPEDAVAVGVGDYTGGWGWSTYRCVALDDL